MIATATAFMMSAVRSTPPAGPIMAAKAAGAAVQNYEISPYRSDGESSDDSDDEGAVKKVYPAWTNRAALDALLRAQEHVDPDEIFEHNKKTCALSEIFVHADPVSKVKKDYSRRTSSGNWIEDRVTAKEQIMYKKAMGYL